MIKKQKKQTKETKETKETLKKICQEQNINHLDDKEFNTTQNKKYLLKNCGIKIIKQ